MCDGFAALAGLADGAMERGCSDAVDGLQVARVGDAGAAVEGGGPYGVPHRLGGDANDGARAATAARAFEGAIVRGQYTLSGLNPVARSGSILGRVALDALTLGAESFLFACGGHSRKEDSRSIWRLQRGLVGDCEAIPCH